MTREQVLNENIGWIDETWKKLERKLSRTAIKSRNKIPYTTVNGEHDDKPTKKGIHYWTNGFWGGLMWLAYAQTKDERYKTTAEISEKRLDEAFKGIERVEHDTGFMWHILSGANYRLTGNTDSKHRNVLAAMALASRYNADGQFIRCWSGEGREGWTIIDSMMNLPQLYWASRELKDESFKRIAVRQADMTMRDHVRENGSVNHIVVHDTETPDVVLETKGGQGYGEGSSWSRGTAWALYGFTLSYIHTKEERYLETAKRVARYFIKETEKTGWLPRLDFRQPETPVYYDSTAGAIAACGLIELSKFLSGEESVYFLSSAIKILQSMEEKWCDWTEREECILQMGSERYTGGIHIPIIYGDYFFTEAILKLKGNPFLAW